MYGYSLAVTSYCISRFVLANSAANPYRLVLCGLVDSFATVDDSQPVTIFAAA